MFSTRVFLFLVAFLLMNNSTSFATINQSDHKLYNVVGFDNIRQASPSDQKSLSDSDNIIITIDGNFLIDNLKDELFAGKTLTVEENTVLTKLFSALKELKKFGIKYRHVPIKMIKGMFNFSLYLYNNSGKLLSKNTLVSLGLFAWPYFRLYPQHLDYISKLASGVVIEINGLIASGILKGMANNPSALSKILAMFAAMETGSTITKWIPHFLGSLMSGFVFRRRA